MDLSSMYAKFEFGVFAELEKYARRDQKLHWTMLFIHVDTSGVLTVWGLETSAVQTIFSNSASIFPTLKQIEYLNLNNNPSYGATGAIDFGLNEAIFWSDL